MLSHYHSAINPEVENDSHSCMLRMVGFNKRVLESGCASGHMSEALNARACSVVGVEIDPVAAQSALPWLERVIVGDFDDHVLWEGLKDEYFDVVLFGDVLEHLHDPLATLRESVKHLLPSGTVVISVPNIAHADVKIALLKGLFPYRDEGLLDRTHVHFFTKESLMKLVKEAGLVITEFSRVSVPVFSTEIGVARSDVDNQVLEAVLDDLESETYQFVVKAVRDDGTNSFENLSNEFIRLTDELHQASKDLAELHAKYQELQERYDEDLRELPRLRHQKDRVKRLLPGPLAKLAKKALGVR